MSWRIRWDELSHRPSWETSRRRDRADRNDNHLANVTPKEAWIFKMNTFSSLNFPTHLSFLEILFAITSFLQTQYKLTEIMNVLLIFIYKRKIIKAEKSVCIIFSQIEIMILGFCVMLGSYTNTPLIRNLYL